jgi:oligoribonuclease
MPADKWMVWIDLEMSGLDPTQDVILEIATIITDSSLGRTVDGPELVISQPDSILDGMDKWNTEHHGASGLIEKVRESTLSNREAEKKTLNFLQTYIEPNTAPLCGNSIAQDRRFLYKYMPTLSEFLHYRNIDVSSIKELVDRWYPESMGPPPKDTNHRAKEDIEASIEELRYYRDHIFVSQDQ